MINLGVWIEIDGLQTYVGRIIGENEEDARFSYAEEYLSGNMARPISIHLPLSENAFSVDDTTLPIPPTISFCCSTLKCLKLMA